MRLKKFSEFRLIKESTATEIEHKIDDVKQEIRDVKSQRSQLLMDMENEAGQMGDEWSDDDANRYGSELNDLDDKEIELRKELEKLMNDLDEEEQREEYTIYSDKFRELVESISDPSEYEVKYKDGQVDIEVQLGEDEFEFTIYSYGDLVLKELNMEISIGDIENDGEEIKKILLKLFSLDGEEYTDFIKSFSDPETLDDDVEKEDEERSEKEKESEKETHPISDDEDLSDQEGVVADETEEDEDA
jgi:uncharacterized protein YukE